MFLGGVLQVAVLTGGGSKWFVLGDWGLEETLLFCPRLMFGGDDI